ncbi:hypothetical protein I551_8393 [Mycobacterium ulcerans str. Harvey]|uniref:PPE family protein n=1 Tax=Mycobacterium ulcerans str. Harvey TaxID=1299332 RepID=A0ABN0QKL0_MYCUL|nr:hypothetical protein I551_8393 [Mycobacterium ulcerans str. Harvey]
MSALIGNGGAGGSAGVSPTGVFPSNGGSGGNAQLIGDGGDGGRGIPAEPVAPAAQVDLWPATMGPTETEMPAAY